MEIYSNKINYDVYLAEYNKRREFEKRARKWENLIMNLDSEEWEVENAQKEIKKLRMREYEESLPY